MATSVTCVWNKASRKNTVVCSMTNSDVKIIYVILCKINHKYDSAIFRNSFVHTEQNFLCTKRTFYHIILQLIKQKYIYFVTEGILYIYFQNQIQFVCFLIHVNLTPLPGLHYGPDRAISNGEVLHSKQYLGL